MIKNEFVNHILELLAPYGDIKARAMFGGYGIYKDGVIIGIIAGSELYFKTDKESALIYEAKGSKQLSYDAKGKTVKLSYWQVPLDIMEDEGLLSKRVKSAWRISLNAK